MDKRLAIAALGFLAGCATSPPAPVPYDFTKVKSISVAPFEGVGGQEARDALIRELVRTGIEVKDSKQRADLILRATMTDFKPASQMVIFLGKTSLMAADGQNLTVVDPLVSQHGYKAIMKDAGIGRSHTQVVSVVAVAGATIRVINPSNQAVVWAGNYGYESLDMPGTLQALAEIVSRALAQSITAMKTRTL